MKRLHLFEFEDQSWFPENIRNYMTDYLQAAANSFRLYDDILPILKKGIEKSSKKQIIDLASGGGGGWLSLASKIKTALPGVKVLLTDFYPNVEAFKQIQVQNPGLFDYSSSSIDATNVPKEMTGLRTQFLSFHHFKPEQARKILQNAVDAKQPIAIFEAIERTPKYFALISGISLSVYSLTPFIKPFNAERLALTYLVPVIPFFVSFDGLVSVCRVYSQEEMAEMTKSLADSETFEWEIGKIKKGLLTIQYLLGYPKQ
jgi:hypothetical protein